MHHMVQSTRLNRWVMYKGTINLVGQKRGKLTVLEKILTPGKRGARWKCKCDCGNFCIVQGGHFRAGNRVSCGCKSQEKIYHTGIGRLISLYKTKARNKNRNFNLTREHFERLVSSNCYYCKKKPENILLRDGSKKIQIIYNGIDRVDSEQGYTEENCVSCCKICNRFKSDMNMVDWINHVKAIYEEFIK